MVGSTATINFETTIYALFTATPTNAQHSECNRPVLLMYTDPTMTTYWQPNQGSSLFTLSASALASIVTTASTFETLYLKANLPD